MLTMRSMYVWSCRPPNPVEYLAHYLLKNNPEKKESS